MMVDGAKREDGLKKCQLNLRVFLFLMMNRDKKSASPNDKLDLEVK